MSDQKTFLYGKSTVAMCAYGLLCKFGQPSTRKKIFDYLSKMMPGVDADFYDASINEAVHRGFLYEIPGDGDPLLEVADPGRRIPVDRDESDTEIDEETGEPLGGWSGWICVPVSISMGIPIEDAIKQTKNAGGFILDAVRLDEDMVTK